MHPELFTIPVIGIPIDGYPFFVLVGLFAGLFTAKFRAKKVGANHELIPSAFIIVAVVGLIGSRLFYVVHYWQSEFADLPHPIKAAMQIGSGGAELYGGVILATIALLIYFKIHRVSLPLYCDILVPSIILAQAFGRLGCFMFGCCWGGLCVQSDGQPALPWAVQFPFGSLPYLHQHKEGLADPPDMLCYTHQDQRLPIPAEVLRLNRAQFGRLWQRTQSAGASTDIPSSPSPSGRSDDPSMHLSAIKRMLSDGSASEPAAYSKLQDLRREAGTHATLPIHPVQLYAALNAFLLSLLLSAIFKRRARDGIVLGTTLLLYPITRIIQEVIRSDNPHDVLGLTVSTALSLVFVVVGLLILIWLHRLPRQYPLAKQPAARA